MNTENAIDYILDNLKGLRRDRALKIVTGQTTEAETKQYIINEFVRYRMEIIRTYRVIEELRDIKSISNKKYKHYESTGDIVHAAENHIKIFKINNDLKALRKCVGVFGARIIYFLKLNVLTEHEACQLFNINYKTFQNAKNEYSKVLEKDNKDISNDEHLIYSVIAVCAPEYRHRRGRLKEWLDCPYSEMPIYWAIHEYMLQKMQDNEEFKEASDKAFKECFPGVKTYRAIKDLEGNIIKIEEE